MQTFLFAGHDTTASALAWIIYYLALFQDIQQKVKQEVDGLLIDDSAMPTYEQVRENITYTNAVIKEVLRLYLITICLLFL
jgi:cytochrome P450